MINKVLVEQRLALISGFLARLRELGAMPQSDFLGDPLKVAATESYLRRTLEAVFDVGRHLLAKSGYLQLAGEYKSIARGLSDRGFIDGRLGSVLVKMAGYRNRMVHMYYDVTPEEMYAIVSDHLEDIAEFVRQVRAYVEATSPQQR